MTNLPTGGQDENTPKTAPESATSQSKPNEQSGIYVRAHVKIFDPESGVTYINTSA